MDVRFGDARLVLLPEMVDFVRDAGYKQVAVSIDYDASQRHSLSEARAAVELGSVELIVTRITDAEVMERRFPVRIV